MSGAIEEMKLHDGHDIDVFPEGAMPGFSYTTFHRHSELVSREYQSFVLYRIDKTGLILLKGLAGRDRDYNDIDRIERKHGLPPLDEITNRFAELKLRSSHHDDLMDKFEALRKRYYDNAQSQERK